MRRYVSTTYIIGAVYQSFLAELENGVYRITDLAPDDYASIDSVSDLEVHEQEQGEELWYRTFGWPRGMSEVTVALNLSVAQSVNRRV